MALFGNLFGPPQQPGMQPAAPLPRVPWNQNPMVTTAALSLLGGRNLNEGLANVAATAGQGMAAKSGLQAFMLAQQEKQAAKSEADARKAQMNDVLKAWPGLTEQQRALFSAQPELFGQYAVDSMGAKSGGTFAGTGLDAQDSNILLSGDPSSPEYAMAFSRQYETPKMVTGTNEQGQMIVTPVMPPVPPGIRRPTGGTVPAPGGMPQQQVPGPSPATTATGGPIVGAPIVTGTAKPTEQQNRQRQLYEVVQPELSIVKENFPALSQLGNQAAAMATPQAVQGFLTTPEYQRAANAMRTIIATYLYSTSGATANPGEVENQVKVLMPMPGESPEAVADKLRRVETMVESIKTVGGPMPPGGSVNGPASNGAAPVSWQEYFK